MPIRLFISLARKRKLRRWRIEKRGKENFKLDNRRTDFHFTLASSVCVFLIKQLV